MTGLDRLLLCRDAVRSTASVDGGLALERVHTAADGTRKLVFRLISGPAVGATVETVLIPIVRRGGERPRLTVCVSSQVGCAMNCQFCYTGRMGLMCALTTSFAAHHTQTQLCIYTMLSFALQLLLQALATSTLLMSPFDRRGVTV